MKFLMLLGGVTGFGFGLGISLFFERPWTAGIWHGCLAAYALGMGFRWWGRVWETSLRSALAEKQAAAAHESSSPQSNKR